MKKKLIAAVLAIIMCVSLTVPALAVEFSDLKDHWAQEYMEDLAQRKLLSGYEDGTMRPNANITACETLSLLSHLYSPSDAELKLITADYGNIAKATVPLSLAWAYDEIELCIAAGIVTESELNTLQLAKPIEKERLSLFLVRAMQKQTGAKALESSTLTFADAADISSDCKGSVAELSQLGIIKGDDNNKFNPASSVARAVVATMVSRTLDYLENNKITLTLKDYSGLSRVSGIITAAGSGSIEIRGTDGLVREYRFTAAADVTVNGVVKTLSSLYVGGSAELSIQNGTVVAVSVTDKENEVWVQGTVYSVSSSGSNNYLYITSPTTFEINKHTIPSTAAVTRNGASSSVTSLIKGDYVTMKKENGIITAITAANADREITGEITELKFGSTVTIKAMDSTGVTYVVSFDITYPPKIVRGSTTISVDRLTQGSKVTLSVEDGIVKTITAEGSENSLTGELSSITSTTSGTQWVIAASTGSVTLTLDKNAGVYSGSTPILLTDIQAGDTVTVYYYGSTITDVYLVSSTNSSSKLTGTVLTVDSTKKLVTVLTTSEKIVYVDAASVGYIINAIAGRNISISSLTVDSQLIAYGAYSDSTNFGAKTIVIEFLK